MDISVDERRFDDFQVKMLEEIVFDVRTILEEADMPKDKIRDLTGDIAFSVAAIIDGSREMHCGGKQVIPFLTFINDNSSQELIAVEGGYWMHEYTPGIIENSFENPANFV